MSAVTALSAEATPIASEPVPAAQMQGVPTVAAEAADTTPVAAPDAPKGKASGVLGTVAHKVVNMAKTDVDVLGIPGRRDSGRRNRFDFQQRASGALGFHMQAVEERRAQPTPALLDF